MPPTMFDVHGACVAIHVIYLWTILPPPCTQKSSFNPPPSRFYLLLLVLSLSVFLPLEPHIPACPPTLSI